MTLKLVKGLPLVFSNAEGHKITWGTEVTMHNSRSEVRFGISCGNRHDYSSSGSAWRGFYVTFLRPRENISCLMGARAPIFFLLFMQITKVGGRDPILSFIKLSGVIAHSAVPLFNTLKVLLSIALKVLIAYLLLLSGKRPRHTILSHSSDCKECWRGAPLRRVRSVAGQESCTALTNCHMWSARRLQAFRTLVAQMQGSWRCCW